MTKVTLSVIIKALKTQKQIPTYSEIPYLDYAQIFVASSIMYDTGKGKETATFDVTVRDMPGKRNFLLLGGVEEMVNILLNWKYDRKFVDYLLTEKVISRKFAEYLKNFKFRGDVFAMPEGTVFFPTEPVIRITTSLSDANLLTAFLVDVISYPTLFLSKAVRIKLATNGKPFFLAGAMRAFSFESVVKIQRLSYILESIIAMPYFGYRFGVGKRKPAIGFYHALIKSFANEEEAYKHFLPHTADFGISTSMIDTYDIKTGIENWIKVEKEARKEGKTLGLVSIDSGNVLEISKFLRNKLDKEGLTDTHIVAYSNLDEFKVAELEKKGAKIDVYCPVTEIITVSDRPVLEAVYKLAEIIDKDGNVRYTAKFSKGKISLPGRKQVFRKYHKNGKMREDIIAIEHEKLGEPLLTPYIKHGRLIKDLPSLDQIKEYLNKQLSCLPKNLRAIERQYAYKVSISQKLNNMLEDLRNSHLKSHKV